MKTDSPNNYEFDIALSFAGEDRQIAQKIAQSLKKSKIRVFYDEFEKANLWGKDLYEHLADVYSNRARYCVVLISSNYAKKNWTTHERKNAQARAFRENQEYILPIRLDDTEIPGIPETVGYIDLNKTSISEVVDLIKTKLGKQTATVGSFESQATFPSIPLPEKKPKFTQLNKDKFLKETFYFIKEYFKKGLSALQAKYSEFETDFDEVTNHKFICKLYEKGQRIRQCKIWIGGVGSADSILFSESSIDMTHDNSFNDILSLSNDETVLGFQPSNMWFANQQYAQKKILKKEDAAEYLWKRFTQSIQ